MSDVNERTKLFEMMDIKDSEATLRSWLTQMGVTRPDQFVLDHVRHILGQPKSTYLVDTWNTEIRKWSNLNTEHGNTRALSILLEILKDVLESSTGYSPEAVLEKVQNVALTIKSVEEGRKQWIVVSGNRNGTVSNPDDKEVNEMIDHALPNDLTDFLCRILGDIMER